jgi:hypothetical protein
MYFPHQDKALLCNITSQRTRKKMTEFDRNLGLVQTQKCGRVKLKNWDSSSSILITVFLMAKQI